MSAMRNTITTAPTIIIREEVMCEANAYLLKGGKEELLLEEVDVMRPEGDQFFLRNVYGEQKTVKANLKEISLLEHRIVLEAV